MSSLKFNVSIYYIANIASALVPFFLMPILTRQLGAESYGVVAMFMTCTTMLGAVVGLNVHNGLATRWYDRDVIDFSQYVGACIIILIISASLTLLAFFEIKSWLSLALSIPVFWLYTTIILSIAAFLTQMRLTIWQVQEKSVKYGSLQFGQALLNGLLSYIFVVVFLFDLNGRLWGQVLSVLPLGLLSLLLLYKEGLMKLNTRWAYLKDALAFGVPLIPHVVGAFFLLMADRIIINIKLGTVSSGIYMVAVQIALGFGLLNESFNKAFMPRLFSLLKQNKWVHNLQIVKLGYIYFMLLLMAPIFSIIFGQFLVKLLAGSHFMAACSVLNWLILMQSFHGMYYFVTGYMFFEQKTYITSGITIICGCINLILTFYFIDFFGLVGAGISSAVSMLLQFLITWIMAAKVHPMPWFSSQIFRKQRLNIEVTS